MDTWISRSDDYSVWLTLARPNIVISLSKFLGTIIIVIRSFNYCYFRHGHVEAVAFLIDGGHCQVDAIDQRGFTALHYAAWYLLT